MSLLTDEEIKLLGEGTSGTWQDDLQFARSIEAAVIKKLSKAVDLLERLGNKVAELEAVVVSEQQDYKEVEAMLHAERDASQALRERVAEQERALDDARRSLKSTDDHYELLIAEQAAVVVLTFITCLKE